MDHQLISGSVVLSGPVDRRDECVNVLTTRGLLVEAGPQQHHDHGLPSHTDPVTAHAAGHPNSGHTPGTPHPAVLDFYVVEGDHKKGCTLSEKTGKAISCAHVGQVESRPSPVPKRHHGKPYEPDPGVGWITVHASDPGAVTVVASAAVAAGWQLRMHTAPRWQTVDSVLSPEERLARIERELELLRAGGSA